MPSRPGPVSFRLEKDHDIVKARRTAQAMLEAEGMRPVRVTRFATAVSEIARNTVYHGGGGNVSFAFESREGRRWLTAEFEDRGKGIADIEAALGDGFTTGKGMGLGLGGAKRLTDAFEIRSDPETGTVVKLACRLT